MSQVDKEQALLAIVMLIIPVAIAVAWIHYDPRIDDWFEAPYLLYVVVKAGLFSLWAMMIPMSVMMFLEVVKPERSTGPLVIYTVYVPWILFVSIGYFSLMVTVIYVAFWLTLRYSASDWFLAAAVFVAWPLYLLRIFARIIYGTLEIGSGIGALIAAIHNNTSSDFLRLIAILGGVYILIRGLDNMEQGIPQLIVFFPRSGKLLRQLVNTATFRGWKA